MMTKQIRFAAFALLCALGTAALAPTAAFAGKEGKRNTAIGLGAVAVYGVAKKKPLLAGLAGGAALYSYTKSRQEPKRRRRVVRVHHHYRGCGRRFHHHKRACPCRHCRA